MSDSNGGRRKDGKPYAEGNVREDGSYEVGRNRTPAAHRFAVGDGRCRGRRPKGTKNLATEWQEELSEKITITENGRTKRISKRRGVIKACTAGAMKGSDRKIEIAFRYAEDGDAPRNRAASSDADIVAAWLAQQGLGPNGDDIITQNVVGEDDPTTFADEPDAQP